VGTVPQKIIVEKRSPTQNIMKKTRCLKIIFLLFVSLILTSGCTVIDAIGNRLGTATLILYTPITYCEQIISPATHEPRAIPVYIYRIDGIINNQDRPVTLLKDFFYLSLEDTRLPVTTSRTLETFPDRVRLVAGEAMALPGALSLRANRARMGRLSPPDATHAGYRIGFPPLIYDPGLHGEPNDFILINQRGRWSQSVDFTPCTPTSVRSLVESTR